MDSQQVSVRIDSRSGMPARRQIPFEGFPSAGPSLHFAHANGYPPKAYLPLFDHLLPSFGILAMYLRSFWPGSNPDEIMDWEPFTADMSCFLDEHDLHGIPGIGHSVGGTTTLRLALRQPERFSAVILLSI